MRLGLIWGGGVVLRWVVVWACGVVGASAAAQAQEAAGAAAETLTFDSPRAVLAAFAEATDRLAVDGSDEQAWATAVACLPPEVVAGGAEAARDVAEDLGVVFGHIRAVVPSTLPDAAEAAGQRRFLYFPVLSNAEDRRLVGAAQIKGERVLLRRGAGAGGAGTGWRFGQETTASARALAAKLEAWAAQAGGRAADRPWVEGWVPPRFRAPAVLDVRVWQWVALGGLFVLAVMLDFASRVVVGGLLRRLLRGAPDDTRELIRRAARPLGMGVAAWLVLAGLHVLGLSGGAEAVGGSAGVVLGAAVRVFLVLTGVWAGWRLLDVLGAFALMQTRRSDTKFDDVLVPLVRKGLKIAVLAVGLVYAAKAMNVDLVPLLTGLGIGSLAFAFAAKDTIENFFGSIAVILDRPFEVGDWVVIGDVEGTVEELGFRSTRVRTFYNSQLTVPNATLVRATVDNYGRRQYRRWKTHLGVQYDTSPEQLVAFTEGIRELVRTHPFTRKDYYQVWMHSWSASSMDVLLYVFFEVPDWNTELRERERLFLDIVRLADRLGVAFAFPTQTVHLHQADGSAPAERAAPPTSMTDRRSMVAGIRAAQELIADQPWREVKPGPQTYGQVGPTALMDEAGNATLEAPGAEAGPETPTEPAPGAEPGAAPRAEADGRG